MKSECKYYDKCDAPICPMDENKERMYWYPDEEICRNRNFSKELYIQNQKKIAKRAKDTDKLFTFKMLNRNIIIKTGIEGIDPDKSIERQEREWIKKHPEKSEEYIRRMKELGERLNAKTSH